jgi:hypothetical protein
VLAFHRDWAWIVVCSNALVGCWALAAHYEPRLRSRKLWWSVLVAEATIVVQVVTGSLLIGVQHLHAPDFHAFYGFGTLIAAALIYSYRPQLKHVKYLLYGLGSLFLMGLAIRAMQVG